VSQRTLQAKVLQDSDPVDQEDPSAERLGREASHARRDRLSDAAQARQENARQENKVREEEERELAEYAVKVGRRLRLVRKQMHLSLQAVEARSNQEFKASVLGAYERGERFISVPRLQRLAELYNVPVSQLLPRDDGEDAGAQSEEIVASGRRMDGPGWDAGGKVTVDLLALSRVTGPERDLLRRFLSMIQVQRQDFNGRMITVRGDDLRAIACLFGVTPEVMVRRLDDLGLRVPSGSSAAQS
jgi:transcriptional regulator with XRE-family HTH domain